MTAIIRKNNSDLGCATAMSSDSVTRDEREAAGQVSLGLRKHGHMVCFIVNTVIVDDQDLLSVTFFNLEYINGFRLVVYSSRPGW